MNFIPISRPTMAAEEQAAVGRDQGTAIRALGYTNHWSCTEQASAEVLSLPIYPGLGELDLDRVAIAVKAL